LTLWKNCLSMETQSCHLINKWATLFASKAKKCYFEIEQSVCIPKNIYNGKPQRKSKIKANFLIDKNSVVLFFCCWIFLTFRLHFMHSWLKLFFGPSNLGLFYQQKKWKKLLLTNYILTSPKELSKMCFNK